MGAPDDLRVDPARWGLSEVVATCGALRACTDGGGAMEDAAQRMAAFLRRTFVDTADGAPAFVLTRLFKTMRYADLPADLQAKVDTLLPGGGAPEPGLQVLTLLGTDGEQPQWCDRRTSAGHQVIPLLSAEAVERAPMVAALMRDLGVGVEAAVAGLPPGSHGQADFDVFHVPEAVGSPLLPAQDFVTAHGVRSVVGFGGVLPSGQVFAVVGFSRVHLPERCVDNFRTLAVSAKLALLPFSVAPVFADQPARPQQELVTAQARVGALEQLLEVEEATVRTQADQLERSLHIIETLRSVGEALSAELDLDRVVQKATDASVELTGAAFGAFFYNVISITGESYMLWTISGVDRSEFEKFPMPRNTAVFAPTFAGEGVVRSDDITADPRYGHTPPHFGMPAGHLPVRSYLAAPVVSLTGEVHGGLFFGHPDVGVFDDRAERLVVGIAAQTAAALDNARMYRRQRQTALELQRALLPQELPQMRGLTICHRYQPGAEDIDVGGDWYDVIKLSETRVGFVIGDVMGRGVQAAAAMGQLRTALRAVATIGMPPGEVLRHLNDLANEQFDERLATCLYAICDIATGALVLANAGHLPPLIAEGGHAVTLDVPAGCPLGAVPGATYDEQTAQLAPGASLVLYTDGLVESRDRAIDVGIAELIDQLEGITEVTDDVCDKVLSSLILAESNHDDDVALLVATITPPA